MGFAGPMTSLVPTGTVLPFAGSVAPAGFLICDGSSLSRTTFAALFAAIGIAHGAPDTNTFNLPDYRGRFMRGLDGPAGRDTDSTTRTAMATGGNAGNQIGSVQPDGMRSHTHLMYSPNGGNYGSVGNHSFYWGGGGSEIRRDTQPHYDQAGVVRAVNLGDTRPVNATVNFIVKY